MDIQKLKDRLTGLGYTPVAADDPTLTFLSSAVESTATRELNISDITPLESILIDKAAGEFLRSKTLSGQDIGIDATGVVSISEGDTTVKFSNSETPGAKMMALVEVLMHARDGEYYSYRRLRW